MVKRKITDKRESVTAGSVSPRAGTSSDAGTPPKRTALAALRITQRQDTRRKGSPSPAGLNSASPVVQISPCRTRSVVQSTPRSAGQSLSEEVRTLKWYSYIL